MNPLWTTRLWLRQRVGALLVVAVLAPVAVPAIAQEVPDEETTAESSRAALLRQERAEKEQRLERPKESWVQEITTFVEENRVILDFPRVYLYNFRPVFGGLRSGSGTTAGIRYEPTHDDGPFLLVVDGVASVRRYWQIQGVGGYETGALILNGFGRYRHLPQEPFFGIGSSSEGIESTFTWDEGLAGGLTALQPVPGLIAGVTGAYQSNALGRGEADHHPTLDELTDVYGDIPAYEEESDTYVETDYAIWGAFVEFDRRDVPYDAAYGRRFAPSLTGRRGLSLDADRGFYASFDVTRHVPVGNDEPYAFTRYGIDLQQYIPVRNDFHVFALREFVSLVDTDADSEVPFYKMATIGGGRSLRGFDTFRFRDRNVALFNAEYRWWVWVRMDMALFVDAGYVFHEFDEITLDETEVGYGIGFRYTTSTGVAARLDVAFSRHGPRMYLKLGGIL